MEQREFVVEQETAGQRIDRFLSGEDTGLSRSALQALVRKRRSRSRDCSSICSRTKSTRSPSLNDCSTLRIPPLMGG